MLEESMLTPGTGIPPLPNILDAHCRLPQAALSNSSSKSYQLKFSTTHLKVRDELSRHMAYELEWLICIMGVGVHS